ncbi:mCG147971 [Mus musculus]|uniref:Uncharacterized protein n=2 Tax=Mus TaxID=862507 RepID=Q8C321_MOUSE|nr:mCG147971 [Mus musculus]BAC39829.1 unnamed protein product [Mus musculus]BAE36706.1 unnamed protein product [Mus musculus]
MRCLGSAPLPLPRPHTRALNLCPALLPAAVPRQRTAEAATGKSLLLPVRPLSFLAAVIYGKSGRPGGGAGREARGRLETCAAGHPSGVGAVQRQKGWGAAGDLSLQSTPRLGLLSLHVLGTT